MTKFYIEIHALNLSDAPPDLMEICEKLAFAESDIVDVQDDQSKHFTVYFNSAELAQRYFDGINGAAQPDGTKTFQIKLKNRYSAALILSASSTSTMSPKPSMADAAVQRLITTVNDGVIDDDDNDGSSSVTSNAQVHACSLTVIDGKPPRFTENDIATLVQDHVGVTPASITFSGSIATIAFGKLADAQTFHNSIPEFLIISIQSKQVFVVPPQAGLSSISISMLDGSEVDFESSTIKASIPRSSEVSINGRSAGVLFGSYSLAMACYLQLKSHPGSDRGLL